MAKLIQSAIEEPGVAMQSLIFPDITSSEELAGMLRNFGQLPMVRLELKTKHRSLMCLGYRICFDDMRSYATGFGNYFFLPATRRAPYTEIVFRSKPRSADVQPMKTAPPGIVHLADLKIGRMPMEQFTGLWNGSFGLVKRILGHSPDLRSAARTTFAVPKIIYSTIASGENALQ